MDRLIRYLIFFAAISLPLLVSAQDIPFDPADGIESLERLELILSDEDISEETIRSVIITATVTGQSASQCRDTLQPVVDRYQSELDIFGEVDPDQDIALWENVTRIRGLRDQADARLQNCALVASRASDLIKDAEASQSKLSAQKMWRRGDPVWANPAEQLETYKAWQSIIVDALTIPGAASVVWILIVLVGVAVGVGFAIQVEFKRWVVHTGFDKRTPRLSYLMPKPLADHAPVLLGGFVTSAVLYLFVTGASLDMPIVRIALSIFAYGLGMVFIDWTTGPLSPSANIEGLVPDFVKPLRVRLRWFLVALLISFTVLGTSWLGEFPEELDLLPRVLLALLISIPMIAILLLLRQVPGLRGRYRLIRFGLLLAVVALVLAEILGYHNFANYLSGGVVRTVLAILGLWLGLWLVEQSSAYISKGGTKTAYQIRTLLGVTPTEKRTGMGMYQLVVDTVLWLGFALYLIFIWDAAGNTLDKLSTYVTEGFNPAGNIRIVPAEIILGIMVFIGLIIITGWAKRWIQKRWLRHMTMDRGARDALVTLVGYVGFIIATIIGMTLAGVDFAGLALVAGALSVGIGFGLQSIANNFISGLILLFERPIKAGDFVTVGTVEGFVRRISIRSTEIETLDNQNVIVPNSELISGQVTNWVLRNPAGRLRIPVGVAYGSPVRKVKEILETVSAEHPEVITDSTRATPPKALFMGFGDSSLDFELRVRIKRIERRYDVTSDINFAIDEGFRENGITIPFPQRDLHVRTVEQPLVPSLGRDHKNDNSDD